MIVFIYSTYDNILDFRHAEFIQSYPEFWSTNSYIIDEVWRVDTEDEKSMKDVLTKFKVRGFKTENVSEICSRMGFDLVAFLAKHREERQPLFIYNKG